MESSKVSNSKVPGNMEIFRNPEYRERTWCGTSDEEGSRRADSEWYGDAYESEADVCGTDDTKLHVDQ